MTTGKTIVSTRRTFVGKVMSLLLNMLSRLVITFLPRSKHLLISWLQSPSAVIWALPYVSSKEIQYLFLKLLSISLVSSFFPVFLCVLHYMLKSIWAMTQLPM